MRMAQPSLRRRSSLRELASKNMHVAGGLAACVAAGDNERQFCRELSDVEAHESQYGKNRGRVA